MGDEAEKAIEANLKENLAELNKMVSDMGMMDLDDMDVGLQSLLNEFNELKSQINQLGIDVEINHVTISATEQPVSGSTATTRMSGSICLSVPSVTKNGSNNNKVAPGAKTSKSVGTNTTNNSKGRSSPLPPPPSSSPSPNYDKVLELLFVKMFTIKQLFPLRLVCKKWNSLITKVLGQKESLKLVVMARGDAGQRAQLSEDEAIEYIAIEVGRHDCRTLKRWFPHVKVLDIICIQQADISPLLKRWPKTLTSIALAELSDTGLLERLWSQLESLPSLNELHLLHLHDALLPSVSLSSVLSRLQTFTLSGYKGNLSPVLSSLSSKCTALTLDEVELTSYQIFKLMQECDSALCTGVRRLQLGALSVPPADARWSAANYKEVLTLLAMCMPAVTELELHCASEFRLDELAQRLANFKQLTTLHLIYRATYVSTYHFPKYPPEANLATELTPVPSVERLFIRFGYLSFERFYRLAPVVFPRVKHLKIDCEDADFVARLNEATGGGGVKKKTFLGSVELCVNFD